MENDTLDSEQVRKYVRRAGGTTKVAHQLRVSSGEVVRWAIDGLLDEQLAIRLMDLGEFRVCRYGVPPRCTILQRRELDRLIDKHGGMRPTADWLNVSVRTLRRYRSGDSTPPEPLADRIRAELSRVSETRNCD